MDNFETTSLQARTEKAQEEAEDSKTATQQALSSVLDTESGLATFRFLFKSSGFSLSPTCYGKDGRVDPIATAEMIGSANSYRFLRRFISSENLVRIETQDPETTQTKE